MSPLVIGGVGLAAILGLLWATSGTAGAKQSNTQKNAAAGGAAYAAGKVAGFTMGGVDAVSGFENLNPEEDAGMIAQSKTSGDPVAFLKGVPEGYAAGYAGGIAAKKIGTTYASSEDDVPPPPPEPPAAPAGKPVSYVANPNTAGHATAYGSGHTYGRKNSIDNAPGSGNANALKTSNSYAARLKFDEAQMTLWSSSWDKGYQDGWDKGQFEAHEAVAEAGAEPMLKVGGLLSVGHDSKTGNVLDVGGLLSVGRDPKTINVGGLLSVGYDSRTGDVLRVGSLLSVGFEPQSGTVLKVAGARVLGVRRAYHAPILKLSKTPADRVLACFLSRGPASDSNPWTSIMLGCALDELGRSSYPMASRDVAIPTPADGPEHHYYDLINAMYDRNPSMRLGPVARVQFAQLALDAVRTYRPKIGTSSSSSIATPFFMMQR